MVGWREALTKLTDKYFDVSKDPAEKKRIEEENVKK